MTDNQEWLDGLKVGDTVAVESNGLGKRAYHIAKIEKITPTRRFVVGGRNYNSSGAEISTDKWSVSRDIVPVTPEIVEEIKLRKALTYIHYVNFESLQPDMVIAVYELLKAARNDNPEKQ
jgi:hypothetical protein